MVHSAFLACGTILAMPRSHASYINRRGPTSFRSLPAFSREPWLSLAQGVSGVFKSLVMMTSFCQRQSIYNFDIAPAIKKSVSDGEPSLRSDRATQHAGGALQGTSCEAVSVHSGDDPFRIHARSSDIAHSVEASFARSRHVRPRRGFIFEGISSASRRLIERPARAGGVAAMRCCSTARPTASDHAGRTGLRRD